MSEQQIISKLDDINKKVDELLLWKAALNERCDNHLKTTSGMHQTLYTNPGGIVLKVQKLENCKNNIKGSRSRWTDFWMFVLRALVVAGVISFIGLIAKILGIINLLGGVT